MKILTYNLLITLLFCASISYADSWPNGAKRSYVERCSSSMASQGLPTSKAQSYCGCIANGMEREFGMKEYNQMMKAQVNPNGSSYDKRLYNILKACQKQLSR